MKRKRLVDRSKIAKKVGGPETVRKLHWEDKLLLSAAIAEEIGKERAAKKCVRMVVEEHIRCEEYEGALSVAHEWGVTEEMKPELKQAALKEIEMNIMKGKMPNSSASYKNKEYYKGLGIELSEEEIKQVTLKVAELIIAFDTDLSKCKLTEENLEKTLNLTKEEMKQAASKAIERMMKNGNLEEALSTADRYELKKEKELLSEIMIATKWF